MMTANELLVCRGYFFVNGDLGEPMTLEVALQEALQFHKRGLDFCYYKVVPSQGVTALSVHNWLKELSQKNEENFMNLSTKEFLSVSEILKRSEEEFQEFFNWLLKEKECVGYRMDEDFTIDSESFDPLVAREVLDALERISRDSEEELDALTKTPSLLSEGEIEQIVNTVRGKLEQMKEPSLLPELNIKTDRWCNK